MKYIILQIASPLFFALLSANAQINITPDTSSPLQTSGGFTEDVIIDTTAGTAPGDIGSSGSPFVLEQSGFLTILEVGSISADLDDGDVFLDGTELFFSGDLTISPSNFTSGIAFFQDVSSSSSNTEFTIGGGVFAFEGDLDIQAAEVTVSDAEIGIADFLFIDVESVAEYGSLVGAGTISALDFGTGSTLQIVASSGLEIGDSFNLIDNFSLIAGEPTTVAVDVDGTDGTLTEIGSTGVYEGTVEGTEFQFNLNSGVLSVVPEPSAASFLTGIMSAILLLRRRGTNKAAG